MDLPDFPEPASANPAPGRGRRLAATATGLALAAALLPAGAATAAAATTTAPAATTPAATAAAATTRTAPGVAAGSVSSLTLVGQAERAGGGGYWAAFSNGTVEAAGNVKSLGGPRSPDGPVVGIAATRTGVGYWLVTSKGAVYAYGAARFHGGTTAIRLNRPVVGIAPTSDDGGYWLVASDGGVFTFGNARFHGTTAGIRLNRPIVGIAPTPAAAGYWLVASDGGVFTFGNARYHGSTGAIRLNRPVIGLVPTATYGGYWLVASDGGVFTFGNARFRGSAVGRIGAAGVVGMSTAGAGYWMLATTGRFVGFDAPTLPSVKVPVVAHPLPAGVNPARSIAPSAAFDDSCFSGANPAACNSAALSDIDAARASEGYGPLPVPKDLASMNNTNQLITIASAERTSRGLPALPQNASLDGRAQAGADTHSDPDGPAGYTWDSNVSWGYLTPLAADYAWMYDDGTGSPNVDCTSAGAAGCWGHRRNILSPWGGASGAGSVYRAGYGWVMAELFVKGY